MHKKNPQKFGYLNIKHQPTLFNRIGSYGHNLGITRIFLQKKKKAAKAAFFGFTQLTLSGLRSLPDFSVFALDGK